MTIFICCKAAVIKLLFFPTSCYSSSSSSSSSSCFPVILLFKILPSRQTYEMHGDVHELMKTIMKCMQMFKKACSLAWNACRYAWNACIHAWNVDRLQTCMKCKGENLTIDRIWRQKHIRGSFDMWLKVVSEVYKGQQWGRNWQVAESSSRVI